MMTNYEKLISDRKYLEELIDRISTNDNPGLLWFDKKYCKNCETVKATDEESGKEYDFFHCEIYDKCKFFESMGTSPDSLQMVKMWLDEEYVNE